MAIKKLRTSDDDVIGNYRILRMLGRGGMGEVYLAWTGLRLVAIKILNPAHANDAEFVQMFLAEARLAARLNHTGIASVLDVGEHDGRIFIVMEYVAGQTLDELLRDPAIPGLLPLRIACTAFANVAQALGAAHRAQIVHRDISPHNLLVSFTGAVKLIDFGIARTQSGDSHTSPGTMRGRFGYMAPEYVQGLVCDHRVDLFSLGVVMWETFARQRLYAGTAAAQMFAMVEKPAERLDELIAGFPIELADLVAKLLQRDPGQRYARALDVANDLVDLLPRLPDDGFRNLEHWITHHLAQRIEARAFTDREALMRFTSQEVASRATGELPALRVLRPLTVDGENTAVEWAPLEGGDRAKTSADEGGPDVEDPSVMIEQSSGVPQPMSPSLSGGLSGRSTMTGLGTMGRITAPGATAAAAASPPSLSGPVAMGGGGSSVVAPMPILTSDGTGPIGEGGTKPGAEVPGGESLMGAAAAAVGTGVVERPGWAKKMGLTELMDQRRGLMLVAALSAVVVVLSLWLGLRGELRARRATRGVVAVEPGGEAPKVTAAPGNGEPRLEHRPAPAVQGDAGAATVVQADAMTAAGPAVDGGERRSDEADGADEAGASAAGDDDGAEIELEPEIVDESEERSKTVRSTRERLGHPRGKGNDKTLPRGNKAPENASGANAGGATATGAPVHVAASSPTPPATGTPGATTTPPSKPTAPTPAVTTTPSGATTGPLAPSVPKVTPPTLPRTPRVPSGTLGDEERGANVVARCNACHSQSKARQVAGKQMTRSQWERFFKNGSHDRNLPLGDQMSDKDMANAKAFLILRALDSSFDQGAGVR